MQEQGVPQSILVTKEFQSQFSSYLNLLLINGVTMDLKSIFLNPFPMAFFSYVKSTLEYLSPILFIKANLHMALLKVK